MAARSTVVFVAERACWCCVRVALVPVDEIRLPSFARLCFAFAVSSFGVVGVEVLEAVWLWRWWVASRWVEATEGSIGWVEEIGISFAIFGFGCP